MITLEERKRKMPKAVQIEAARYVAPYRLCLRFDDGHESTVDFGQFLRGSVHPSIRAYLDLKRFKGFSLEHGMLHWNDFDLVFPMSEFYEGRIKTQRSCCRHPVPRARQSAISRRSRRLRARPDQGLQGFLGPAQGARGGQRGFRSAARRGVRPARARTVPANPRRSSCCSVCCIPTKGHIEVFGHSPRHVATKSRIGYLPEESYLYRYLNSRETLDFFGNLFHLPRSDRDNRARAIAGNGRLEPDAHRARSANFPRACSAASAWPRR